MRGQYDRGAPRQLVECYRQACRHSGERRTEQVMRRMFRMFGMEYQEAFCYAGPYDRKFR